MKNNYCLKCKKEVDIIINDVYKTYVDEDNTINYMGKEAICSVCGEKIYNDELMGYNQKAMEDAYKTENEIITKEQIEQIIKKYSIGKRPLSLLMGFGEITITRYLDGYVPTKENSKYLKKILNSPSEYYSILQMNKNRITTIAFEKSEKATRKLLGINSNDTIIEDVSKYIVNKIEVSNMALQKLLYYVQLFYMGLYDRPAFTSICKAWKYGPVFGSIYHRYKGFESNIIKDEKQSNTIDSNLKEVVDNVIKYFGCYTPLILKDFTHNEKPWIVGNETSEKIIEKSELKSFASELIKEYNIVKACDIKNYSIEQFLRYM